MMGCNARSAMGRTLLLVLLAVLWLPPGTRAATTVLVLGDSLSAAYGIAQNQGWVHLLQQRITANGGDARVINASISGETTSGGRTRITGLLKRHRPAIVIVELGGNDGLRGLPVADMAANLNQIIVAVKQHGAKILLLGMRLPPNYGPAYTREFHETYARLAAKHAIPLVPFMLEGLTDDETAFQADRIHPTAAAQARILDNVWPALHPLLNAVSQPRAALEAR